MIIKKLDDEELALLEILENPVWCASFLRQELDPLWEHTKYQREVLADFGEHVSFRAARAVGKTETIVDKISYFCINNFFPTKVIALITPNRVHLDPIWRKLNRWLHTHPFLKHFAKTSNSQVHKITLQNGITVDCRIAGNSATGASVIGLHTPILLVDEAGFFPWSVWIELMPCLNTWEDGFQVMVGGTPSGQRENNVLYYTDIESSQFNKHRVTSFQNPRYTEEADLRNQEQYGGQDSDDYQRLVLGEHASKVTFLFSRQSIPTKKGNVFTATLTRKDVEEDPEKFRRLLNSLPNQSNVACGIDLGYTDPTIISLFNLNGGEWINFARITLENIEYPRQIRFLNNLDDVYNFIFMAIDEGHAGIAVTQTLINEYKHKNYKNRLFSISFGKSEVVGIDLDGNEIKNYVRNIAVEKLRSLFDNNLIYLLHSDKDLLDELERVESVRTSNGRIVYRVRSRAGSLRGEDHRFASLLCFAYSIYLREDVEQGREKVKLFSGKWIRKR